MPPAKTHSSSKGKARAAASPLISVIIPGHNRPDSLRETLAALRDQTLPPSKYEVILVGFTGTTLQAVADENAARAKHAFTYKEIGTRWPDAKRNEGIRLARGKICAFTDDDVLPDRAWLEKMRDAFEKNPLALGVEGCTDGDNTPLLSHATKNLQGGEYPTCNLAFRTEILKKIGGFDEAYHFFREDTDIAYQVLQHGPIVFDPDVKVFHPTRKITANSILRELGMTRGEIRLAKKFPARYHSKYGLVGRGGWLQSIFSWAILLLSVYLGITSHFSALLAGMGILYVFRSLVSFRTRAATVAERIDVFVHMLIRDLAYPFFFAYFWLTENPVKVE